MLYFANPCGSLVLDAMRDRKIGFIDTPAQGNKRPPDVEWCADNGCFGKGWPGNRSWLDWLGSHASDAAMCHFATAPDVVADASATMARSRPWLQVVRSLGYPVAFVAQDGLEDLSTPWDEFDVLFIGGTTEWKLGPAARALTDEAKKRGHRVHMGRVNSYKRLLYATRIGCDTADGTYLTFGPTVNLPKLLGWLTRLEAETT